jgi:hypothetical protein
MRASLLNGFELLHRSSFDMTGVFYSAFFQLSTGTERLMKVAFILDYKIENNLENPTNNILRDLGHFILELYAKGLSPNKRIGG